MSDLNDDIKRYVGGLMSPAERHALERRALDDPFLADALLGGESIGGDFDDDVDSIQRQLAKRVSDDVNATPLVGNAKGRHIKMLSWPARIAAGVVILLSASALFYLLTKKHTAENLALNQTPEAEQTDAWKKKSATPSEDESGGISADPTEASAPGESSYASGEQGANASSDRKKSFEDTRSTTNPGGKAEQPAPDKLDEDEVANETPGDVNPARQAISAPPAATAQSPRSESLADAPSPAITDAEAPPAERAVRSKALAYEEAEKKDQVAGRVHPQPSKQNNDLNVFKGKVVDADGTAIPGVNVLVKGTNTGTVSDIDGNYQLALNEVKPVLVFSFIGYANVEERSDTAAPLNIILKEDLTQLSEVVVAGYGVEREDGPIESTFDFATPAGGRRAFRQYLEKQMQYPAEALLNNVEGRVTVQFSVASTGALGDFRVVKSLGSGCDEEVIRLIKSGPKWSPTKRDDIAEKSFIKVRMKFQLPKEKKK